MITIFAWIIALPLILPLIVFSFETFFGLAEQKRCEYNGDAPYTVLLMPAHDEGSTIGDVLEKLKNILSGRVRLLVVADNCTDDTAQIVRSFGYDVIERHDTSARGKGHALAFGRDFLRQDPPECVIIFDADCETDFISIRDLCRHSLELGLPVQARYVMRADRKASPIVQISNFAFWLKNAVRQRGTGRMGGAALLTGTGMAFPWKLFETLPLATSNIVEDLALGIYLTESGNAPAYLDQALVTSAAAGQQATLSQRTRWEHGFLAMAREYGLKALWQGLTGSNRKLFQLGLHLTVAPITLLFTLSATVVVLTGASGLFSGEYGPFLSISVMLFVATALVFSAWVSGGKNWLAGQVFWKLPFYILWKIPVYLKLVKGETPNWVRTDRE
jgi:cellulose synthase/poly-beta-1,6-N-acetylglucosamine synthase-like glycosyltransferase